MKTVMVIGCSGLIGHALVKKLLDEGYDVVGYSRNIPDIKNQHFFPYIGELYEISRMVQAMLDHQVEVVVHNAALSHPKMAADDPYKMFQINLAGVINSIEAARITGVKRYLFASAAGVYGNNISDPITEDMSLQSECAYDSSKIAAEEVVKNYGIECGILRIGFVYGPGRVRECPIAMLLKAVHENTAVRWDSGADQYLDYVYIDDVVRGMTQAVGAEKLRYKVYNMGGGMFTPYRNVVKIVQELFPQARMEIGSGGLGYDNIGRMDNSRAWEDFGYKPQITLEEGIRRYDEWLFGK